MINKFRYTVTLTVILWLNANGAMASPDKSVENPIRTLEWSELIPAGFDPNKLVEKYQNKYNIDNLPDDDFRVTELMQKLEELQRLSPVNTALDGIQVRIPGYVVPLETDGMSSSEFLLVPYFGACIHVPPPPLNQTVYVTMEDKNRAAIRNLFDIVWVTGVMRVDKLSTELAEAGYVIQATKIVPYE